MGFPLRMPIRGTFPAGCASGLGAGVIDEALLAGAMDLAHRQAPALEPPAVDLAELGVAVAIRVLLEIFEMEQLESDAGPAPLGVQVGAVRDGAMMRGRCRGP